MHHTIEKLQKERILSFLPLEVKPAKLEVFDSIDSTNSYLLSQAKNGDHTGWVCLAEEQTNGRGRLGRTWVSPPVGNIYCSLIWQFENFENLSGLSIVIGVLITYLLKHLGVSQNPQLKWPNDVLIEGKKLAGILLESTDRKYIVIGIGINWAAPLDKAIGLSDFLPGSLSRNEIAAKLIYLLFHYLPIFGQSGLSVFLNDWRKHDCLFGESISLILPNKEISGVMQGINDKGELILATARGEECFCYGEVSVKK